MASTEAFPESSEALLFLSSFTADHEEVPIARGRVYAVGHAAVCLYECAG